MVYGLCLSLSLCCGAGKRFLVAGAGVGKGRTGKKVFLGDLSLKNDPDKLR
jgi:hypothetical protein